MNESDKLFMETAEKQQETIDSLLEACKLALGLIAYEVEENHNKEWEYEYNLLQQAIAKAEGKKGD